ncbi:M14 family metallopeptidase [Paenibacillus herberti]|uniref:Peptidase M14 n=1 Tax=Paenibacillus herberti TaxID=1619309 RepID=A0A229P4S7_9BACL|nr:M14 family metallocarboxypeptidase [Paenibacillus herberti]OXM16925.1 peptidase M14 [Paenibacillus herberti]
MNRDRSGKIVQACRYGPAQLAVDLDTLQSRYRDMHRQPVGTSVMGKRLESLRIGSGPRYVFVNAAFHANEWITSLLLMMYAEELLERQASGEGVINELTVWLLPMVNPDGVELALNGVPPEHPYGRQLLEWNEGSTDFSAWKANIRGVDLNDQFPACWELEKQRRGKAGPGPRDYPGDNPLSEPESRAVAALTERESFDMVAALHTQGEEIYWNYRGLEPPESEAIAERLSYASGYAAVALADSDAGYKDWFIQKFRRPGFTIEAGLGENPLPLEQWPDMYGKVQSLLDELLRIARCS